MSEGRLQTEWSQTAEILSLIYNMNRGPKSKAIPSWKFNPFGKKRREAVDIGHKGAWDTFRGLFDRGAFGGKR